MRRRNSRRPRRNPSLAVERGLEALRVLSKRTMNADPDRTYGMFGAALEVRAHRLVVGYHVTKSPEQVLAALKSNVDLAQARQTGDLGGGLYFSAAPQLWMGRSGHKSEYIQALPVELRPRFVEMIYAVNSKIESQGYLTRSEQGIVHRDLSRYAENDPGWMGVFNLLGQPFNLSWTNEDLFAYGLPSMRNPVVVESRISGVLFDYAGDRGALDALYDGAIEWWGERGMLRSLRADEELDWRKIVRHRDAEFVLTPSGRRRLRAYGRFSELVNEFARVHGVNGAFVSSSFSHDAQAVIFDSAAIRTFGKWRNPRPAPSQTRLWTAEVV